MKRPYRVAEYVWDGDPFPDETLSFPSVFFGLPDIAKLIACYKYWRGTFKVTIKINATRFHYGRLMAVYTPNGKQAVTPLNHGCLTSYPHVMISANDSSPSELMVPWIYPYNFFPLGLTSSAATTPLLARVHIFEVNPLRLGATVPPVTVTVFVQCVESHLTGLIPSVETTYAAQSRVTQNVNGESLARSKEGVFSSTIQSTVRTVASYLHIPRLSPALGLASYVTGKASTFFEGIGLCKPLNVSNTQPVYQKTYSICHGMGVENALPLSVNPENQVGAFSDVVGTPNDEMLLSHLFRTPTLIRTITWVTDNGADSYALVPVCPCQGDSTQPIESCLAAAAMPFNYWRGSICFQFDIVCSAFHSGRLSIGWLPYVFDEDAPPTGQSTMERVILDIQEGQTFSVQIPYLQTCPWLLNGGNAQPNGYLVISVLNVLTSADVDATEVDINVWISGGEDFQVAMPNELRLNDIQNGGGSLQQELFAVPGTPMNIPVYYAQGLTSQQRLETPVTVLGGGSLLVDNNVCMGEHLLHVKQLACRPVFIGNVSNVPLHVYRQLSSGSAAPFNSWFTYFSQFYAGYRGGVVIKVVPPAGLDAYSTLTLTGISYTVPNSPPAQTYSGTSGSMIQGMAVNSVLEATIPYYVPYNYLPTANSTGINSISALRTTTTFRVTDNSGSTDPTVYTFYESAADDFSYGGRCGYLPIGYPSSFDLVQTQ